MLTFLTALIGFLVISVVVVMNDCANGAELHYRTLRDAPGAKALFPDIGYAAMEPPWFSC